MAEEKDLRDILGNLNNAINRLGDAVDNNTQHVTKLTKSIGETVSTIKSSSKSVSANKLNVSELDTFLKRFRKTLETNLSAGARDSSGNLTSYAKGKITRAENDLRRELAPVLLQVQARNKNTSNNPISITDSLEGSNKVYDKINEILSKRLAQDRDTLKAIFSDLGVSTSARRQVKGKEDVGRDYKVRYDSQGNVQYVEDVGSDFAKLRDDVVALRRTLGETSKEVQTSNSHFTALSTNLQDLIDKSKTLNAIFEKINTSSTSLQNTSLPGLTTAVGDARTAMNSFVSGQNNALKSLNKSINNTIKTQQTVTNQIMQTAQKQSQQTQTGSSGNTFSRQVQKNDERARQAGFIAMLIPALAKLIEKTPFSDFIKVAGLMIGKFMPEIGALVASLAPVIGAAALTKGGGALVKLFRGKGAGKLAGGALRGVGAGVQGGGLLSEILGSSKGMPLKQKGIWLNRWFKGFKGGMQGSVTHTPKGLAATFGGPLKPDEFMDARRMLMTERYARSGVEAPTLSAEAYLQGRMARRKFQRGNFSKISFDRTAGGLGKFSAKWAPNAVKMARGAGGWAATGSILEDLLTGQFTNAYKQDGWKGVGKQTLKTGAKAGVSAGGAIAGGMLGSVIGPVGTIIGSVLGSIVADILYKSLAKPITEGFKAITAPFKSTFASLKTHFGELFGGIGKAFKSIWGLFQSLMNGLKIFKPIADWVTKWVGRILGGAFGLAITGVAKAIDSVITPFAKAANFVGQVLEKLQQSFHDFGQKLLTMPIIGKKLQEIYGPPETETVQKSVEGSANPKIGSIQAQNEKLLKEAKSDKYKVGTPYYNAYKDKLVAQYIRVNTPERRGLTFGNDETRRAGEVWAEKKIADEYANKLAQYRRNKIKVANMQNAVGTALPSNLKYETKNGITAVAMSSLGLRGGISRENSIPYIAAKNAQNLKNLDAYLSSRGYKFDYTSAMGGSHAGGAKSHGAGQKVDLVLRGGGRLKKEDEEWLMRHGFYGGNTGAVGYHNAGSGFHYDLSVGQGAGLAASAKVAANVAVATATETAQQTSASLKASSEIREGLAKAIGEKKREDKTARARNIIFSAVDVTGSLGVWGITQINNTGRDAGRMRTGI